MQGDRPGVLTSPWGPNHQGTPRPWGHTHGAWPWAYQCHFPGTPLVLRLGATWRPEPVGAACAPAGTRGRSASCTPAGGVFRVPSDVTPGQRPAWHASDVRSQRPLSLQRTAVERGDEGVQPGPRLPGRELPLAGAVHGKRLPGRELVLAGAVHGKRAPLWAPLPQRCSAGPAACCGGRRAQRGWGRGCFPRGPRWAPGQLAWMRPAWRPGSGQPTGQRKWPGATEWGRQGSRGLRARRRGAAPGLGPLCRAARRPGLLLCSASPSGPRASL